LPLTCYFREGERGREREREGERGREGREEMRVREGFQNSPKNRKLITRQINSSSVKLDQFVPRENIFL
jgi:hypothetical protein